MSKTVERRFLETAEDTLGVEERADGRPRIRGMAAVYNRPSQDLGGFREVLLPGCFDHILERTYKRADVIACWNHDPGQLLGRTSSGTLTLTSDEKGLRYEIDPPDTQLARDLMALVRRGDVFGSSFAFTVDSKDESFSKDDTGTTIRTIRKVSGLYDVSLVTNPAYLATNVSVRSFEEWTAAQAVAPEESPKTLDRRRVLSAIGRAFCHLAGSRTHG